MPFRLFTSNRLEVLSAQLADVLRTPLTSPFEPEVIVVQSQGMERWLSLQLAGKLGICANMRFPFPNTFVTEIARQIGLVSDENAFDPFGPGVLTWRIMRILPECLSQPEFEAPKRYLENGSGEQKLIQLSHRIADLFDQYLLFRPDLIKQWENGRGSDVSDELWQATLWRSLTSGYPQPHRAAIGTQLIETLQTTEPGTHALPQRISVFGISTLPPFYQAVLDALTRHTPVNLFLMNPCQEYWGEIRSRKEITHARRKASGDKSKSKQISLDFEADYFEEGHRLLASMGELGRDFLDLLLDLEPHTETNFHDPGSHSCLSAIQSDILKLEEPVEPDTALIGDRTIQLHSCHSQRREIEVLQDHLLALFESDPELKPTDVVVMAPDIETYNPFIQSVFDLPEDDPRRLPYRITDRSFSAEDEIIDLFLTLLGLSNSRLTANEVLNILETPVVSRKYGLSEDDLQLIQHWVRKTRIRWGADAEYRSRLGLPGFQQNTWQEGLRRLLFGYAMPAEQQAIYGDGIVPYDDIEGEQADVLGKLLEFADNLFRLANELRRPRPLREWQELLQWVLETFFEARDESLRTIYHIRRIVLSLGEIQTHSKFEKTVDVQSILYYLHSQFRQRGYGFGYLTGGVTFCSMLPMRSIPFKVVCLIGMNSDAYPRSSPQLGFDLMQRDKRRGDRSRRADDRYLFLESVLSARNVFYISYIGQSIKDNSDIPPSVVVIELLDYLAHRFDLSAEECHKRFVTSHRLQGFSRKYFLEDESDLFTYSKEDLQIARGFLAPRVADKPFIETPLPEPEDELRTVSVSELYRFFRHPAKFLLNRRLGIYIPDENTVLEDDEPFKLEKLERYEVAQRLKTALYEQFDRQRVKAIEERLGALPHGIPGEYQYISLEEKVERFVARTLPYLDSLERQPLPVDVPIGAFRLTGRLDLLTPQGNVMFEYASANVNRMLRIWIDHLVHNCVPSDHARESYVFAVNSSNKGEWQGRRFKPLSDSDNLLEQLLEIYWRGLTEPLRFFPRSSWEYIENLRKPAKKKSEEKAREDALKKARDKWGSYFFGEKDDPYFQLCFGHEEDALNQEFCSLAVKVLDPLFDHYEELA